MSSLRAQWSKWHVQNQTHTTAQRHTENHIQSEFASDWFLNQIFRGI